MAQVLRGLASRKRWVLSILDLDGQELLIRSLGSSIWRRCAWLANDDRAAHEYQRGGAAGTSRWPFGSAITGEAPGLGASERFACRRV